MNIPTAQTYEQGLKAIKISTGQRAMLECHYLALNRTVTYTELAAAAGSSDFRTANLEYGQLGRALGEEIGYNFPVAGQRGEPFFSGALGIDAPRSETREFRLMMHHELAKAIDHLGWFKA